MLKEDNTHELIFQQVGDPDWPFGSTHARVILKSGINTITKYKFDVHNDGANISKGSWSVDWNEDSAECIVCGEEQCDQLYRIYYDGHQYLQTTEKEIIESDHASYEAWSFFYVHHSFSFFK